MGTKLTYSSLPQEVKRIANDSMGLGVLRSLFSYSSTYHLVMKIEDGIFIGFALYHLQKDRMQNGDMYTTGIIDAVCVAAPYRNEGFGTLLTFSVLRKLSAYGVDRVEITMKKPHGVDRDGQPGVPVFGSEDFIKSIGFRKIQECPNFYEQKSKKFGYYCVYCGDQPDSCSGVLFAIDSE